ncbi:potassium channel regulatory factor protein [Rutstroemia sp. NJR-2017a BVV2]|nr:potassium channel regulatory factor protein [Rutstroemia sp. NJR-2017a BVV2]
MDFASLMAKEISKKAESTGDSSKKYMKRSEIEAERQAKYIAEQRAIEAEREAKLAQKRKREDEEAEAVRVREEKRRRLAEESRRQREEREVEEERKRRKRLGLPELVKEDSQEVEEDDIKDEELIQKLREMGNPAKLFAETHKQRLRRYRKLGIVMTTGPIPTTLQLVEEKDMKVDTVPKDEEGRKYLFRQLASYFTMVLTEWEQALEKEKRDTFASKAAYNAMVQSKENMTPVSPPTQLVIQEPNLTTCSSSASSKKET